VKIKYSWIDDNNNKDIDSLITTFVKEKPFWWSKIAPFIKGCKNPKEILDKFSTEVIFSGKRFATIKRCHGMHQLFNRSILLKWPCDVRLEIETDGSYLWRSGNTDITISYHHPEQAPTYLGEKYAFIKPSFKFFYATNENCLISFVDPILYMHQPYRVCPGIIECTKNKKLEANVILLFNKGEKMIYEFNAGDPMAMMQFDKKITKVEYDKYVIDLSPSHIRKKIF
jgi:hypothetical protein